jgi:ABC-type sugar transport system permease subunit
MDFPGAEQGFLWPEMGPLWLTLRLAASATLILLLVGTPIAWWLTRTRSRLRPAFEAVIALPLVLPPTVLGFYLLILLSPSSALGGLWLRLTDSTLTFSFAGSSPWRAFFRARKRSAAAVAPMPRWDWRPRVWLRSRRHRTCGSRPVVPVR